LYEVVNAGIVLKSTRHLIRPAATFSPSDPPSSDFGVTCGRRNYFVGRFSGVALASREQHRANFRSAFSAISIRGDL
jgi:hypothetical protein